MYILCKGKTFFAKKWGRGGNLDKHHWFNKPHAGMQRISSSSCFLEYIFLVLLLCPACWHAGHIFLVLLLNFCFSPFFPLTFFFFTSPDRQRSYCYAPCSMLYDLHVCTHTATSLTLSMLHATRRRGEWKKKIMKGQPTNGAAELPMPSSRCGRQSAPQSRAAVRHRQRRDS